MEGFSGASKTLAGLIHMKSKWDDLRMSINALEEEANRLKHTSNHLQEVLACKTAELVKMTQDKEQHQKTCRSTIKWMLSEERRIAETEDDESGRMDTLTKKIQDMEKIIQDRDAVISRLEAADTDGIVFIEQDDSAVIAAKRSAIFEVNDLKTKLGRTTAILDSHQVECAEYKAKYAAYAIELAKYEK